MAMTFRQIIDRVLRTVAEDPVDPSATELTDDYHKLVATFINQIKEEIEDAHTWRALWTTIPVTVLGGQSTGVITGSNERGRVVKIAQAETGQYIPLVFDVTVPTNVSPLYEMDNALALYRRTLDIQQGNQPSSYSIEATSTGVLQLRVYPTPATTRTINVTLSLPQAELADTDLDVIVKIPSRPLIMGSVYYALAERGEELGVNNIYTEERSRTAIDDAIARDMEEQGGLDMVAT